MLLHSRGSFAACCNDPIASIVVISVIVIVVVIITQLANILLAPSRKQSRTLCLCDSVSSLNQHTLPTHISCEKQSKGHVDTKANPTSLRAEILEGLD